MSEAERPHKSLASVTLPQLRQYGPAYNVAALQLIDSRRNDGLAGCTLNTLDPRLGARPAPPRRPGAAGCRPEAALENDILQPVLLSQLLTVTDEDDNVMEATKPIDGATDAGSNSNGDGESKDKEGGEAADEQENEMKDSKSVKSSVSRASRKSGKSKVDEAQALDEGYVLRNFERRELVSRRQQSALENARYMLSRRTNSGERHNDEVDQYLQELVDQKELLVDLQQNTLRGKSSRRGLLMDQINLRRNGGDALIATAGVRTLMHLEKTKAAAAAAAVAAAGEAPEESEEVAKRAALEAETEAQNLLISAKDDAARATREANAHDSQGEELSDHMADSLSIFSSEDDTRRPAAVLGTSGVDDDMSQMSHRSPGGSGRSPSSRRGAGPGAGGVKFAGLRRAITKATRGETGSKDGHDTPEMKRAELGADDEEQMEDVKDFLDPTTEVVDIALARAFMGATTENEKALKEFEEVRRYGPIFGPLGMRIILSRKTK
jgi:hypothetical protein